jgi:hypothetical protein
MGKRNSRKGRGSRTEGCSLAAFSQDGEPIDEPAVKHENASKSALSRNSHQVKKIIESSDLRYLRIKHQSE